MFVPEEKRDMANSRIALTLAAAAEKQGERKINYSMVNATVALVIPEQYRDMVSYFIGLAGRVS